MTVTAQEQHEGETRTTAAELRITKQFEVCKTKTSDLLSSRYVRCAAALGIAAAGYVLFRRNETSTATRASEPSDATGAVLKAGSFLVPLVGLLASAMNNAGVAPSAPVHEAPNYSHPRSEDHKLDANDAERVMSTSSRPMYEQTVIPPQKERDQK